MTFGDNPYDRDLQRATSLHFLPPDVREQVIDDMIREAERPRDHVDWGDLVLPVVVWVLLALTIWGFVAYAGWLGGLVLSHQLEIAVHVLFVSMLCVAALAFYRLRCRHKLAYGICEVTFGAASIVFASRGLLQFVIDQSFGSAEWLTPQTTIALIAGLYVMVRGLSNIEDALRIRRSEIASTRIERLWLRLFHESFRRRAGATRAPA